MPNKQNDKLLKLTQIMNDMKHHDGTSLGEMLGITRAAIWKIIKKLGAYDIDITATKGKGYIFKSPLILLDKTAIQARLNQQDIVLDVLEHVSSTNDYLRTQLKNKKIKACLAELQTQGKGRFDRYWHSPFAQNCYISLSFPLEKYLSELSGLSLVVGLALCRAIEDFCELPQPIMIKWPNDIIYDHKKIAGVLIEVQAEAHGQCQVIIGMGINVNMKHAMKKDVSQNWTSLTNITGQYYDRNKLSALILNQVIDYLERFNHHDFSIFQKEWHQHDALLNKKLSLLVNEREVIGTGAGVNNSAQLILRFDDGQKQAFASGDATLKK